jgi:hypothetical protein
MMLTVDGGPAQEIADRPGWPLDDRSFTTDHISPGIHEIKVWRTQKNNPKAALAESEFVGRYCVGSCAENR